MRSRTGLLAVAVALPLTTDPPAILITLLQRDAGRSTSEPPSVAVSGDGRFVAFVSYAALVPADTNTVSDIYVLDRADGRVTLESVTPAGSASTHASAHPGLSGDGRFLVYETHAELAAGDRDAKHVLVRDRLESTVKVVTASVTAEPTRGWSGTPVISQNGAVVAFASTATTLVPGDDANGSALDIYLFDRLRAAIRRVSVDNRGIQDAAGFSVRPSVSGDGRFVAFASTAALDEVGGPLDRRRQTRPVSRVYVRDTQESVTRLISRGLGNRPADGPSWGPAMSADGHHVAFVSTATNLAAADRNDAADVFVTDLRSGRTELVTRSASSGSGNEASGGPAISADGRFIAFQSEATDLVCARRCAAEHEDINLLADVFLLDRQSGVVARMSAGATGAWMESSSGVAIDAEGTLVAFSSRHPVDASDQKHDFDLFLRTIPRTFTASRR